MMPNSERTTIVVRLPDGRTSIAWLNVSTLAQLCDAMTLSPAQSTYVAPTPAEAIALLLDARSTEVALIPGWSAEPALLR